MDVITIIGRKKLAAARKGVPLPPIKGIAIGDGGEKNGTLIAPKETDNKLQNELIRKNYSTCTQISDTSYKYRVNLNTQELAGKNISEIALFDTDGDLLAIRVFKSKYKDTDLEVAIEMDDRF